MQLNRKVEIRHFHLFCGLGGGAAGFNQGEARIGNLEAKFRCLGGIDIDSNAIKDFEEAAGTSGSVLDLFSRDQYKDFHGVEPPSDWREATLTDIKNAAGNERPHIIFLSAPCKGLSGLLPESLAGTKKYKALNGLTVRGVWLALEAYKDDPVELYVFENVPRIVARGRHLLDQIEALFLAYGYVVKESTHCCGEIGGLAESRKRFLLVARHAEKVPANLYEPTKRPLRGVGEVLGRMPMPGDIDAAGPMHRIPSLQWKTWVRLAFIEAGSDWRSLNKLTVEDGHLRDYLIVPESRGGFLGVNHWNEPTGTIAGRNGPTNGAFSVADPRGNNSFAGKYMVTRFDRPANTIISGSTTGQGAFAVADPRTINRVKGDNYLTGGHYGIVPWHSPCGAVSAAASHDNGPWSVADPRMPFTAGEVLEGEYLPKGSERMVALIRAIDGTWHRPFTTLELAALQGLFCPEEDDIFLLSGNSDSDWRVRIGNAVPPPAAKAIASMMGETLLLAWSGQTFTLSSTPVWVRPIAIALTLSNPNSMSY